ncbi:MAG: transposase [Chloroflexi bacterium]|nr:transposase [Chloroflexota bacterium]
MSLQPRCFPPLPEDTAQLARKVFKKGHLYLTLGDQIGTLFTDTDFTQLYAADGAPACSAALLALVTLLQFMEDLSDRATVDAVRGRIEWEYALHLPLKDAGFDASLLCDFRQRLVAHAAGQQMFQQVLQRLLDLKLLRPGGQQRTDGTRVLAAVRVLHRLELLLETLRLALEALSTGHNSKPPVWLGNRLPPGPTATTPTAMRWCKSVSALQSARPVPYGCVVPRVSKDVP